MANNYFVAVYLADRAYGGPEEGGWWFDCGERLKERRVFVFTNEEEAYEFCCKYNQRLRKWAKVKYDIGSVLCEGVPTAHVYENELPDYYPSVRPHYE